jgi:hypothetical protein
MPESVSPKPQRRILYLLLAMFFLPVATSFFLYYGMEWRPSGNTNHGELLQPVRQLPASAGELQGKWALAYVGNGACNEACRHALYIARQTHLLVNKDMRRVNRIAIRHSSNRHWCLASCFVRKRWTPSIAWRHCGAN